MEYKTIYLFCQHRSGSTFLSSLLHVEYEIQMLPEELNILENVIYGKTVWKLIRKKEVTENNLKKCHGSFWNNLHYYVDDVEKFCTKLNALNGNHPDEIVQLVCEELGFDPRQPVLVKYPYDLLELEVNNLKLENSDNLILIRDILDTIQSKINDEEMRERRIKSYFTYWVKRAFICVLFSHRQKNLLKLSRKYNIPLIKYEDVVESGFTHSIIPDKRKVKLDQAVKGKPTSRVSGFKTLSKIEKIIVRVITNA